MAVSLLGATEFCEPVAGVVGFESSAVGALFVASLPFAVVSAGFVTDSVVSAHCQTSRVDLRGKTHHH